MKRSYIEWAFDIDALEELDLAVAQFKTLERLSRPDQEFIDSGITSYATFVVQSFLNSDSQKHLSQKYWEYFFFSIGARWSSDGFKSETLKRQRKLVAQDVDIDVMIFEEYIKRLRRYKLIQHQKNKKYLSFTRYFRESAFQSIGRAVAKLPEPRLVISGCYEQDYIEHPIARKPTKDISRLTGLSLRQVQRYLS